MSDSLSLTVGDRVVYPNQGLCVVSEIKVETIAGNALTFVSLVFEDTGAKVKVPESKLAKNGVRRVSTDKDAKDVIAYLKSDSEKASLDWKKRSRDNTEKLSVGGLLGLAEVVKGLQVLSELRPLPPKEREQYDDARSLFVSELAVAASCSMADAEDLLDIVLFPVGKDRPKRTAEEFRGLDGDELGLGADLLGLDEAPPDEEAEPAESDSEADNETDSEEEAPPKPAAKKQSAAGKKKSVISDVESTAADSPALAEPKKRGRPAKPKGDGATASPTPKRSTAAKAPDHDEPKAAPKKRGRPAKK
jgi:CarD family transcriptional regulator